MTERLRAIADRLRSPELGDEDAEALAREAADLVGKASRKRGGLRAVRAEDAA